MEELSNDMMKDKLSDSDKFKYGLIIQAKIERIVAGFQAFRLRFSIKTLEDVVRLNSRLDSVLYMFRDVSLDYKEKHCLFCPDEVRGACRALKTNNWDQCERKQEINKKKVNLNASQKTA
jgi:hypothetical protein